MTYEEIFNAHIMGGLLELVLLLVAAAAIGTRLVYWVLDREEAAPYRVTKMEIREINQMVRDFRRMEAERDRRHRRIRRRRRA
ncbi:MAG: hypothetical protein IJV04_03630 [Lachnospiraceae bacterium]|nr:hypothetical protein [Lachnospiraceae bacterium]